MLISTFIPSLICVITIVTSAHAVMSSQDYEPRRSTRNTANRVKKVTHDDTKVHDQGKKCKAILLEQEFPSIAPVQRKGAPHATPNAVFNGWQPYGAADASKERMFLVDKESNEYGMICTSLKPIPALLNIG